uniref:WAT1-related protein n=1 Tax=Leersia perrieri TaxID=77586 RepID=A0A0D9XAX6_9ORYZ
MAENNDGRRVCGLPERVQLHGAMLALQFGYAGFHVVSRLALNMGISKLVFPVYRNIIALFLLVPFAYFLEKKDRPQLTLNFVVQFFLLALCGITANQGFYLLGLDNTSPTFASAIQNSVPAITFAMAAALRIERVRLDRRDGIAKVAGTLACVAGASVITLYKGPTIFGPGGDKLQSVAAEVSFTAAIAGEGKNWTLGCVYLIGHCLSWSGWLVLQAPVLKKYPARLSVTSYTCFFGGFIASGVAFAVQIWCIDRGGPVFVAVYQPVQTLVVAIMASLTLGEKFYLGGIIGAVLIIAGLYLVLWGKNQERARLAKEAATAIADRDAAVAGSGRIGGKISSSSSVTQPLLLPTSDNAV